MGCFYFQEQLNEEKILEIAVEKRSHSFISRKEADLDFYFDNEETEALKLDFYKDINNESKLVKYLDNLLKKNDKEKFE